MKLLKTFFVLGLFLLLCPLLLQGCQPVQQPPAEPALSQIKKTCPVDFISTLPILKPGEWFLSLNRRTYPSPETSLCDLSNATVVRSWTDANGGQSYSHLRINYPHPFTTKSKWTFKYHTNEQIRPIYGQSNYNLNLYSWVAFEEDFIKVRQNLRMLTDDADTKILGWARMLPVVAKPTDPYNVEFILRSINGGNWEIFISTADTENWYALGNPSMVWYGPSVGCK